MIEVGVEIDGKEHKCFISEESYNDFLDGLAIRIKPMEYYLYCVVELYGALTEENIVKFMDEKWVL